MSLIPSAFHLYNTKRKKEKKKSYGIKVDPGLLRLVSLLGLDKS